MSVPAADLSPRDLDLLEEHLRASGWPVPTRDHDLCLFGIRAPSEVSDRYDDAVGYTVRVPGLGRVGQVWRATTKPGRRALRERRAAGGVFTLADDREVAGERRGRHPLLWRLGMHHGRPALTHDPAVTAWGWRDDDGDDLHNPDRSRYVPGRGINLHDPGVVDPIAVGNSSEGCIVPWRSAFVGVLRTLVQRQAAAGLGGAVSFHLWTGAGRRDLDALRARVAA